MALYTEDAAEEPDDEDDDVDYMCEDSKCSATADEELLGYEPVDSECSAPVSSTEELDDDSDAEVSECVAGSHQKCSSFIM